MKETIINGSVYVVGDNIDTDVIIPAQYLNLVPTIPAECEELGSHAMAGLPADYPPFVENGTGKSKFAIIIAGRNFGCGSSREHAPIALGAAGIRAIVAESYARIFFRNAVATGRLFPCECKDRLCDVFKTGDTVRLDIAAASIVHERSGRSYELGPLGAVETEIVEAGGLFGYAKRIGMTMKPGKRQTN